MARLDAAADGTILRFLASRAQEAEHSDAHPGTVGQLVFDEGTNGALIEALAHSTDPFRLSAEEVLTKDGEPVAITPPAPSPAPTPAVDPAAIGAALASLPEGQPLTKADLAPLLALFGAGAGQP